MFKLCRKFLKILGNFIKTKIKLQIRKLLFIILSCFIIFYPDYCNSSSVVCQFACFFVTPVTTPKNCFLLLIPYFTKLINLPCYLVDILTCWLMKFITIYHRLAKQNLIKTLHCLVTMAL